MAEEKRQELLKENERLEKLAKEKNVDDKAVEPPKGGGCCVIS